MAETSARSRIETRITNPPNTQNAATAIQILTKRWTCSFSPSHASAAMSELKKRLPIPANPPPHMLATNTAGKKVRNGMPARYGSRMNRRRPATATQVTAAACPRQNGIG